MRRSGYPIGIVRRLGALLLVGVLGSTAYAAPALARDRTRDRDEQKPGLSISVEVGTVNVSADVQAPTVDDPASVSVSAPALAASVSVDPSSPAVSVDAAAPTGSVAVAINGGLAPAVKAAVRVAPPAVQSPVHGVLESPAVEPKAHPFPAAVREARPAAPVPPPAPVVAVSARVHPLPAMPKPKPRPAESHVALATRPRQSREPSSPSVVRNHRTPVAVFLAHRSFSLLGMPRSAFSAPVAPADAALAPAGRDWLRNTTDLFGRSGAALGAGSAAILLFALVTALALAAPRRGLWPRSLVELAPQPALPSLLERPG